MSRIHLLPPEVVTRIAAGEVIERPASVVKELVENSIDAGSRRIDIDLEAGGTELIRVVDDGGGIEPDDLPLAFACHATSKLRTADDLFAIGTLGFRGEALASIGGVARVTLQSRPPGRPVGAEVRCDGGVVSAVRPWNGSPGTRVEVRHLFSSVPARKKFLKGVGTELGHVAETVTRLALARPGLHLTLRHNGRLVYDVPATASLTDRVGLFFGPEVRDALYELDTALGPLRLTGFVADPHCDRGNPKLQYLFVNGRWVRDRSVAHALQEAYRGLMMTGRYPVAFLFLSVPPDAVDVNVHPTKAEVRFRDPSQVYSLVLGAVRERLRRADLVPRPSLAAPRTAERPTEDNHSPPPPAPLAGPSPPSSAASFSPSPRGTDRPDSADLSAGNGPEAEPTTDVPPRPVPLEPLTIPAVARPTPPDTPVPPPPVTPGSALQIQDAYLVLETAEGMLVIDQHALHERILFEQIRRRVRAGQLEVQRLLIPEPIDLPAEQHARVLEAAEALKELGLEVSDFGGHTILLSSYPTLLSRRPPADIFRAVVDHLVTQDRPPTREALLHDLMATMACKAAVKAGDRLTPEEIAYLLHLRQLAEDSHHCPHGRPTSLLFSRAELDRHFRRA